MVARIPWLEASILCTSLSHHRARRSLSPTLSTAFPAKQPQSGAGHCNDVGVPKPTTAPAQHQNIDMNSRFHVLDYLMIGKFVEEHNSLAPLTLKRRNLNPEPTRATPWLL